VISSWFLVANFHRILTSKSKTKYFVINDQLHVLEKNICQLFESKVGLFCGGEFSQNFDIKN
jgi:hypothetical protein